MRAGRLWLFLDYDGTLADFQPTPAIIDPDPALSHLLSELSQARGVRVAVISGRRLADLCELLPVPGLWLAGTYGVEWLTPQGRRIERVDRSAIRPSLDAIKTVWERLIAGDTRFYLEDKGLALALHAGQVEDSTAAARLGVATKMIAGLFEPDVLQIMNDNRLLEVAPLGFDKGEAVRYLLEIRAWPGAQVVYLGDDQKDEAAFETVCTLGGFGIRVSQHPRLTKAAFALASPRHARSWLEQIAAGRRAKA